MVTFPSFLSYIDPNTTHHVFTLLAPLMSVLCFIMGMLVWPFRFALSRAWRRFRGLPRRQQVVLVSAFVAVLAVVAGILYAVLAGEGGAAMARKAEPGPFSRVIVLGMDGLEPEIVEGMMAVENSRTSRSSPRQADTPASARPRRRRVPSHGPR